MQKVRLRPIFFNLGSACGDSSGLNGKRHDACSALRRFSSEICRLDRAHVVQELLVVASPRQFVRQQLHRLNRRCPQQVRRAAATAAGRIRFDRAVPDR